MATWSIRRSFRVAKSVLMELIPDSIRCSTSRSSIRFDTRLPKASPLTRSEDAGERLSLHQSPEILVTLLGGHDDGRF